MISAGRSPDRRSGLRIVAGGFALFWGLAFYGLIDLLAFAQGEQFHAALLLSTGWGLVFLFLVATPMVAIAVTRSGGYSSPLTEVALVAAAVIVAAALSSSPAHLAVAAGLLGTVAVLATLARDRIPDLIPRWRWSTAPGLLVLLAVAPCCAYAWTSARTAGSGHVTDDTWGFDHWPIQAALPLALLLICALSAGHPSGWRRPTWTAGAAAAWFAAMCWLEPDLAGSVSHGWAAITLLWAVAFVAAMHLSSGDTRSRVRDRVAESHGRRERQ
jgi:hypothetical protein